VLERLGGGQLAAVAFVHRRLALPVTPPRARRGGEATGVVCVVFVPSAPQRGVGSSSFLTWQGDSNRCVHDRSGPVVSMSRVAPAGFPRSRRGGALPGGAPARR